MVECWGCSGGPLCVSGVGHCCFATPAGSPALSCGAGGRRPARATPCRAGAGWVGWPGGRRGQSGCRKACRPGGYISSPRRARTGLQRVS
eukprot:gene12021-biopygen18446